MSIPLITFILPLSILTSCKSSDEESGDSLTNSESAWARSFVQDLKTGVDTEPSLSELNDLEDKAAEVHSAVILPWVNAWIGKDAAAFQSLFADNTKGVSWDSGKQNILRSMNGIVESEWSIASGPDQTESYLSQYSSIDIIISTIPHTI